MGVFFILYTTSGRYMGGEEARAGSLESAIALRNMCYFTMISNKKLGFGPK